MAFYNVLQGDAPYLKSLADNYAMSDNYHQAVMGGTGANHIMMGTGDAIWFSDGNGHPLMPPHNQLVGIGSEEPGNCRRNRESQRAAQEPITGTSKTVTAAARMVRPRTAVASYSNCSDSDAPGVFPVLNYLASLPYQVDPKCAPGHWYILNNYNPGYFGDGSNAYTDHNNANTVFTIPPSNVRNIGDELLSTTFPWKYYGDQWNRYLHDKYDENPLDEYCNICNFFQYSTSIMTNQAVRTAHLKDTTDLYADIASGNLPAVSYVKPSGFVDGHPASSKLDLFEGFAKKIVDAVQANPALWQTTAIFVTFDEGGGYYDSGYVQTVDYFGDGTRIPMIVVSPYTTPGHISHQYNDHVSILKFIEYNWATAADHRPQPRQPAQPDSQREQSVRSVEQPRARRPDGPVHLWSRQEVDVELRCGTLADAARK